MHTKEPWEDQKCVERFWSKVDIKGADDCWPWTKGTSGFGYGNFHFGKMSISAHRFSYQLKHGLLRNHDCVCHTCDNPKCVNPAHLWIGTRADNNADKLAKVRNVNPEQKSGELNSNCSLSTPEVIAAKVMHRRGMPQARIASFLGVSNATLCLIVNGERRAEETERMVSACVNACAGMENPEEHIKNIESASALHYKQAMTNGEIASKYKSERDELLAALKEYVGALDNTLTSADHEESMLRYGAADDAARDAIAKAELSK